MQKITCFSRHRYSLLNFIHLAFPTIGSLAFTVHDNVDSVSFSYVDLLRFLFFFFFFFIIIHTKTVTRCHLYYIKTYKQFQIYKGYLDDQRNTDNAWVETVAMNFHDETRKTLSSLDFEVIVGGCY